MDACGKFNETLLPEKEEFSSNLNTEDVKNADYMHAKRNFKDPEIKGLGEDHDFYPNNNTLLLADIYKNFRKMCLKIDQFDPAKRFSVHGLDY